MAAFLLELDGKIILSKDSMISLRQQWALKEDLKITAFLGF